MGGSEKCAAHRPARSSAAATQKAYGAFRLSRGDRSYLDAWPGQFVLLVCY